jgi:hypothetical protein
MSLHHAHAVIIVYYQTGKIVPFAVNKAVAGSIL